MTLAQLGAILLMAAAITAVGSGRAWGCSCAASSAAEDARSSDAVFVSVARGSQDAPRSESAQVTTFIVESVYEGRDLRSANLSR